MDRREFCFAAGATLLAGCPKSFDVPESPGSPDLGEPKEIPEGLSEAWDDFVFSRICDLEDDLWGMIHDFGMQVCDAPTLEEFDRGADIFHDWKSRIDDVLEDAEDLFYFRATPIGG